MQIREIRGQCGSAGWPVGLRPGIVVTLLGIVGATLMVGPAALAGPVATGPMPGGGQMAFAISSTGFENGGEIPRRCTCDGADVSPELSWTEPPPGTQSYTVIADDPDAPSGTWTHWVLFDLPATMHSLDEGVIKIDELPGGERQGRNDFRKIGYNGPCPPPGKPHRYFFKIYALKGKLDLKPGASRDEVERAMQGLVLAQAEWMGKYHR